MHVTESLLDRTASDWCIGKLTGSGSRVGTEGGPSHSYAMLYHHDNKRDNQDLSNMAAHAGFDNAQT